MSDKYPNRPWISWYKNKKWWSLRYRQLQKEPLCRFCKELGKTTAATVVDHIIPHKGNRQLFEDEKNLQSLCAICHSSTKAKIESRGDFGCDVDGIVNAWK